MPKSRLNGIDRQFWISPRGAAMKSRRLLDYGLLGAALLLFWSLLFLFALGAEDAAAYHPHPSPNHLGTMHSNTENEDFCILVYDGSIAHSDVYNRVRGTLYLDDTNQDWEGLSNNRTYFVPYNQPCNSYSQATRDAIEIEFRVQTSGFSVCAPPGPPYPACVVNTGWYWNGAVGHNDARWSNIHFRTNHFTQGVALYHHVVNHEVGHTLGLKDPDNTGHCMGNISVMHSTFYGCSFDREWPTWNDHNTVVLIAENR